MKRSWLALLQQHPKKKKRNKGETDAFSFEAKGEKEKSCYWPTLPAGNN